MANRPKTAAAASASGTIGGIATIIGMTCGFRYIYTDYTYTNYDLLTYIGIYLLVATLFFSSAGFLHRNGKSNYPSLIFIELLNVAVITTCITPMIDFGHLRSALAMIAIFIILLSLTKPVREWITWDRL